MTGMVIGILLAHITRGHALVIWLSFLSLTMFHLYGELLYIHNSFCTDYWYRAMPIVIYTVLLSSCFFLLFQSAPEFEREGKERKENKEVNFVTPQIGREYILKKWIEGFPPFPSIHIVKLEPRSEVKFFCAFPSFSFLPISSLGSTLVAFICLIWI